jgi:predicted transcriptional regulator
MSKKLFLSLVLAGGVLAGLVATPQDDQKAREGARKICLRKCDEEYTQCVSEKTGLSRAACAKAQRDCIQGCNDRH